MTQQADQYNTRRSVRGFDGLGPPRRITSALDDIAIALAARPGPRELADLATYADGYFSALCFVVGVLTGEPPANVAERALRRVRDSQ